MSKGVYVMGISYKKLWMLLLNRDIKKSTLRQELNLASGTWTKLNKGGRSVPLYFAAHLRLLEL